MIYALSLLVIAVGGAYLIVRLRPEKTKRAYQRFTFWRQLFSALLFGAVAWAFIQSGRPELIAIAIVLAFLVALYVFVDKPNETLA